MNDHQRLIGKKLDHLRRMREYLNFSLQRVSVLMPIRSWEALHPENHEALAAFMYGPSLVDLFRSIWSMPEQGHNPTVLGVSVRLLHRQWSAVSRGAAT